RELRGIEASRPVRPRSTAAARPGPDRRVRLHRRNRGSRRRRPFMPLYQPDRDPRVDPEDAVVIVHRFLERCHAWAEEREIPKRIERVAADRDLDASGRLHAWIAWLRFTEHALRELETGKLDSWFI